MIEADDIAEAQEDEAPAQGITFFDLELGMCKFPLGALHDPRERFCGEPAPIGSRPTAQSAEPRPTSQAGGK